MDTIQNEYLVLPMHTKMTINDAKRVAKEVNQILDNIS